MLNYCVKLARSPQINKKEISMDEFELGVQQLSQRPTAELIGGLLSKLIDSGDLSNEQPEIRLGLRLFEDAIALRVSINGQEVHSSNWNEKLTLCQKVIDRQLLENLGSNGHWDEGHNYWYVGAADTNFANIVAAVLEQSKIFNLEDAEPLQISSSALNMKLYVSWDRQGLELDFLPLLPSGQTVETTAQYLKHTVPLAILDGQIYTLSPAATYILEMFDYKPAPVTFSKTAAGPLVQAIEALKGSRFLEVANPEHQPAVHKDTPKPILSLRLDYLKEPDGAFGALWLSAKLDFQYPKADLKKNVVYIRDLEFENDCSKKLQEHQFVAVTNDFFKLTDEAALDFVAADKSPLGPDWQIKGLENIKENLKFSKLALKVSLTSTAEGGNGVDLNLALLQNNAQVPLSSIFKNTKDSQKRWVGLDNGSYALIPTGDLHRLRAMLGTLDPNYKMSPVIRRRINSAQAFSLQALADGSVQLELDQKLKRLASKFRNLETISAADVSKNFEGKLRNYQCEGVGWLEFLGNFELGGILADEMGLGKTVQALAYLQSLKDRGNKLPSLIVAPTSVLLNWLYEARRFTPKLKVMVWHGPSRKQKTSEIRDHDVIITSYALLRIDKDELSRMQFNYLVLDEAQYIKNPSAATTISAKSIKSNHRLAMTGTPTENRPLELWSIMDFLMPGYLGTYEFFKKTIEKPIMEGTDAQPVMQFLNSKTRPFILRRTKHQVEKDLPPKIESVMHVEMTESQRSLYSQILEEVRPKIFSEVAKKGIRGASFSILAALLRLRQVCNHPNSIDALRNASGYESGKFNLLRELTEEALASNHKILIFCQFLDMMAIIREHLVATGVNHLYLDGRTKDRQALVDKFNKDDSVRLFLMSLKAGGTGINLTGADTVILYDPWWNPAVEDQATDRAHRIGQTKTVNVYRLVTEDSVEQKIMSLKEKKSRIVDALINRNGLSTLSLSREDIQSLFAPLPT